MIRKKIVRQLLLAGLILLPAAMFAQEGGKAADKTPSIAELSYAIDNVTLFVCAVLVMFMQTGFAMLTAGLSSAKNTVNILFKNFMDICVAVIVFSLIGYGIMYPEGAAATAAAKDTAGKWFAFGGFGISTAGPDIKAIIATYASGKTQFHPQVDWLFQVAFAGAAATIVAGSMAGRMKFASYLIYSALLTGLIYPISGFWKWGGGGLQAMGFHDFAGSLVVHCVGGFAGLAGAILLGPRIGKFGPDGKPRAMPGHNLALATLGTFILWLGWYGFNPGSQLAFARNGDIGAMMLIAGNTTLAAGAGAIVSMFVTWAFYRKPELSMTLNGALAGLVAITANCDGVTNGQAMFIGGVGGVLVVLGVRLLDILKIDDPVGAWPVHGLNGLWGGIATGIFHGPTEVAGAALSRGAFFWVQIKGSLLIAAWAFGAMFLVFFLLKMGGLLRVSRDEELKGLDIGEHGEEAYSGFQIYTVE